VSGEKAEGLEERQTRGREEGKISRGKLERRQIPRREPKHDENLGRNVTEEGERGEGRLEAAEDRGNTEMSIRALDEGQDGAERR
jgi:hypothetical protein